MLETVNIKVADFVSIVDFLQSHGFFVEKITEHVYEVQREGETPVFIHSDEGRLYFSVDLGEVSQVASQELYFDFLDLNTEILPVSLGIDTTGKDKPKLVLVESRETANLDENEVLSVMAALEIAQDKVAVVLDKHLAPK